MQCVSCYFVVYGSKGRSWRHLSIWSNEPVRPPPPPAGLDNELMVCSSARFVGLLNLAV